MNNIFNNFIDLIRNGGPILGLHSTALVIFSITGFILGIISIVKSKFIKDKYPLTFKLLICSIIITLVLGIYIFIVGYVGTLSCLGSATGPSKAQILQIKINRGFSVLIISFISAFIQSVLLGICCIALHLKKENEINFINGITHLPKTIYLIILFAIPLLIGVSLSLYNIYDILTLKPGENMPLILGFQNINILYICFISSLIGLIPIFILFVKTILTKIKNKELKNGYN